MNTSTIDEKYKLAGSKKTTGPCAVMILPLDGNDVQVEAQKSLATTEELLLALHPAEAVRPVVERLRRMFRRVNSGHPRPAVAFFASETTEGTCFMDFKVERQIIVDEPFRVRDLALCQHRGPVFLALVLGGKQSRFFFGYNHPLRLVKAHKPENVYAYVNEAPERTGNFSDPEARREVVMDKFLHGVDEELGRLLNIACVPVFVAGSERICGHFMALTHHGRKIAGYIYKDIPEGEHQQLLDALSSELGQLEGVNDQIVLRQIESAVNAGRLVDGLDQVQDVAEEKNCRLLLFEKDEPSGFYKSGRVDEIAEKVLENGGEIRAVGKGMLNKYHRIALIKYY